MYKDSTDASNNVKARAWYTDGEACTSDVRLCSAACSLHCLHCLIQPAVLLLYTSRGMTEMIPAGDFFKWTDEAGPFDVAYDYT